MSGSRRSSAVATDPPATTRAKTTPNNAEGRGSYDSVDADDGADKGLTKSSPNEFVQSHFSDGNLNPISNPTPP
jgi:hypothetical protein